MQSRYNEYIFSPNFNLSTDNLLNIVNQGGVVTPPPPTENDFLLLDGSIFNLLDGTNFLLL